MTQEEADKKLQELMDRFRWAFDAFARPNLHPEVDFGNVEESRDEVRRHLWDMHRRGLQLPGEKTAGKSPDPDAA